MNGLNQKPETKIMTTFTKAGKTYNADDAELTNRVFDGSYQDVEPGEQYTVEYAALATDENGVECQIFWQFDDVKGQERQADEYEWHDEECVTIADVQ